MTIHRARSNEGSLTIRIPRHFGGKNTPTFSQPISSPTPTLIPTPTNNGGQSKIVAKSKSLTTSMDKLSLPKQRSPSGCSSKEFSLGCSRGSTPSSARSAVVSRPNSRKSVHSVRSHLSTERSTSENEERNRKSFSPAGSETSLHSVNSSTHSVNSSHSVHSLASSNASARSQSSHPSNKSERRSIVRASSEPPTSSLSCQKMPTKKVSKSVSPAPLRGESTPGSKKSVPVRGSLSSSSLNSWTGDARLEDTCISKMSRKSTPSRMTPPGGTGTQRQSVKQPTNKKSLPVFNSYMSLFQVQEKLKRGEVIEGVLRINPKSYEDAYISAPDGGMDIFIGGVRDRNTALHGDVVAALINPPNDWKILYSQLDAFLAKQEHLKHIVYNESNPNSNVSNSDCASASSSSNIINTNIVKSHVLHEKSDKDKSLDKIDCDVVVEEDEKQVMSENVLQKKKNKKHRRGKKKKKPNQEVEPFKDISSDKKSLVHDSVEVISCPSVIHDSIEVISCPSLHDSIEVISCPSVVHDSIEVISCPSVLHDSIEVISCPSLHDSIEVISCPSAVHDSIEVISGPSVVHDSIEVISCPSVVHDSIENISCPSKNEVSAEQKVNSPVNVVVVPPDQLSECDLSNDDDHSVNSLILDIEDHHIDKKALIGNDETLCTGIAYSYEKNSSDLIKSSCTQKPILNEEHSNQATKVETFNHSNYKNNKVKTERAEPSKTLNERNLPSIEQVMRLPHWEKYVQKTAGVVRIMERKHTLLAAGILKPLADKNPHMALFSPFDSRIPRIKIQMKDCPKDFLAQPKYYSKSIFLAKITEWNDSKFAFGVLCRDIGRMGDIEAETESLLLENSIDSSEFPDSVMKCLPKLPWTIPDEEKATRTDFRNSVIFTIDPSTARDLDDSVSCLQLPNGNFRVGVHIADASYFVPVNSELDKFASERANSVYLIQKVIPMLPRPLCEELCSLNPGEDRLTFSVVWELTPDGTIVGDWFGRTIIRSCCKLSYEHAQQMIDNDSPFNPDHFPQVSGNVSLNEISAIIKNLHAIAVKLKDKRVNDGALKLNQLRVGFNLNSETSCPLSIYIQEQKDSNRLIEEFMLLANITVAHKIIETFPNLALLRKHPPPHDVQIENTLKFLNEHDIHLDATSSKALSDSIQRYDGTDSFSMARMQLIVNMCSKPMQYARYFCSGVVTKAIDQHHYALNVPCYTHFTSPIRRYADIIVHRLLASAIDRKINPLPNWASLTVEKIAHHCNDKRQASKIVQEVSIELFLSLFIRSVGEMTETGIIIGILDRSVDVLVTRLGLIKRCYMEKTPLKNFIYMQEEDAMILEWEENDDSNMAGFTQKLTYFDMVTVALRPFENDALKFNAYLIR